MATGYKADGTIIIGTSVDVGGINTGLNKIQKSFKRLGRLASVALGISALVKLGKSALDAASDLQEIQNVVDVSFGKENIYKIENFCDTCIEQFGMSELAAKQTAGSFAAMGKSMGLTADEATSMAVKLTGLSGDFASFYNLSQDYARTAMSAVYTGETETLKRYGIVLTEANLQEFALSQGIETSVKAMSARDKLILRYQYILKTTADMEGDFVRTQNSWANQVRVLQERWKQLMITMGNGLITVLTPVIKAINTLITALNRFMVVLGEILSKLFGITWQNVVDEFSALGSSTDDAAASQEELADAMNDAAKAAKKAIAPYDELLVIQQDATSTDDEVSSLGLDFSGLDFSSGALKDALDDMYDDINNLYDLGVFVSKKFRGLLDSIPWDAVYEKARVLGTGLSDFLNGLIQPDTFASVGRTIANALNTAIYSALTFGENFDWTNFGLSFAEGVNSFFSNFDFVALAETINAWVQGFGDFLKTALKNIDWKLVLSGIKDFFDNIDPETFAILVGFITFKKLIKMGLISAFMSGFSEGLGMLTLKGLFTTAGFNLATAIKWLFSGTSLPIMIQNVASGLSFVFKMAFVTLQGFFTQTLPALGASLAAGFQTMIYNLGLGNTLHASITYAFGAVATTIAGITALVGGGITAIVSFFSMWENGWSLLKTILEAIGIAIAAVGAVILGVVAGPIAAAIAGAVFAVSQLAIVIHDNWDSVKAWLSNIGPWVNENVIEPVAGFFGGLWEKIKDVFAPVGEFFSSLVEGIMVFFEGLFKRIGQIAEGCWIIVKALWLVVSTFFYDNIVEPIVTFVTDLAKSIWTEISTTWENIKNVLTLINAFVYNQIILPVGTAMSKFIQAIVGALRTAWSGIKNVLSSVATFVQTYVISPVTRAFNALANGIKSIFTSIATAISNIVKGIVNGLISLIEAGINHIINKINDKLEGFNKVVGAAAKLTGDKWSGVDLVPNISIPRLAQGGVIPPNREFLAVLGDQTSGTNIETPLSTMVEAFNKALDARGGSNNEPIVLQLNGKVIAQAVWDEERKRYKQTGSYTPSYA